MSGMHVSVVTCALVCRAHQVALHPREVLGLCVHLYSLAGPSTSIPVQCEEQLQVRRADIRALHLGFVNTMLHAPHLADFPLCLLPRGCSKGGMGV